MGKVIKITGADFSQVAVDNINVDLSTIMQFFFDTIQLGGTDATGNVTNPTLPWRATTDVFKPSDIGLSVGDTLVFTLPDNYMFGLRHGSGKNNVSTNEYWYYSNLDSYTYYEPATGEVGAFIDDETATRRRGNVPITLDEYNVIVFGQTSDLNGLNVSTLKSLIITGHINFEEGTQS